MYILRSCGQVLRYGHEIIKPIPSRPLFSREIQAGRPVTAKSRPGEQENRTTSREIYPGSQSSFLLSETWDGELWILKHILQVSLHAKACVYHMHL